MKNDFLKIQRVIFFVAVIIGLAIADRDQSIRTAVEQGLFEHNYWLDLLHYKPKLWGGYKSEVTSSTFFRDTVNGPRSPRAEMEATIRAFFEPIPSKEDEHAICIFPARLRWLKQKGVLTESDLPSPDCKTLKLWYKPNQYQSISLTFATGFLKNPASYFGHVFLKFNKHPVETELNLRNRTVNYGADTRANDNPFVYAIKGLLGGYNALYSQDDFYAQNTAYGSTDLRDLWEYELNLTPNQIEGISLRIWELFGESFDYYFLNQNCAYFITDPLEKELGITILPKYLPYSLPKQVIEGLMTLKTVDGIPLVKGQGYNPSRQNIFYNKYKTLNQQEQDVFYDLIRSDSISFLSPSYVVLAPQIKKKLLDVLLDYVAFVNAGKSLKIEQKEQQKKILLERFSLPVYHDSDYQFPEIKGVAPSEAPKTILIAAGTRFWPSNKKYDVLFRLRLANHDALSSIIGRAPNSSLEVFSWKFYKNKENFGVDQFDLLKIEALNTSMTGLPGDGDLAWGVQLGYGRNSLDCINCNVFKATIQGGYALGNSASWIIPYALAGGTLQSLHKESGYLHSRIQAGFLINRSQYWALRLDGGHKYFLDGKEKPHFFAEAEVKFSIAKFWDIRFLGAYENTPTFEMYLNTYW